MNPDEEFPLDRAEAEDTPTLSELVQSRNEHATRVERFPELLRDFYNTNDAFTVSNADRNAYSAYRDGLSGWEREVLDRAVTDGWHFHFVEFENLGGLVTPLPLRLTYGDGAVEDVMIPAQVWRRAPERVTIILTREQPIASVRLDPLNQTFDVDLANNMFPREVTRSRLELFKAETEQRNLMADMLERLRDEAAEAGEGAPLTPNP